MRLAVGYDIDRIDRFKKILKNKNFLLNIFSEREIKYCLGRKKAELFLAQKFACKEAVFKALSSLGHQVPLKLIEILNRNARSVIARIPHRKIDQRYKIFVSISNTKDIVMASSIVERSSRGSYAGTFFKRIY